MAYGLPSQSYDRSPNRFWLGSKIEPFRVQVRCRAAIVPRDKKDPGSVPLPEKSEAFRAELSGRGAWFNGTVSSAFLALCKPLRPGKLAGRALRGNGESLRAGHRKMDAGRGQRWSMFDSAA